MKDGYHWELTPLTFGRVRLIETDGSTVEDFY